jgi:hypothetical protein
MEVLVRPPGTMHAKAKGREQEHDRKSHITPELPPSYQHNPDYCFERTFRMLNEQIGSEAKGIWSAHPGGRS